MGGGRAHAPVQVPAGVCRRARCRAASPGPQAVCAAKAGGSGTNGRLAGPPRPYPKSCTKSCTGSPLVPGTSEVPFPILRRARPQAAVSATSACVTWGSATKPLRWVTLPPGPAVPTSGRAVRSASVPSRGGGPAWGASRATTTCRTTCRRSISTVCFRRSLGIRGTGVPSGMRCPDGRVPVALEGSEHFRSRKPHCGQCSTRRVDGETGYFHGFVCASMIAPDQSRALPLAPESVRPRIGPDNPEPHRNRSAAQPVPIPMGISVPFKPLASGIGWGSDPTNRRPPEKSA